MKKSPKGLSRTAAAWYRQVVDEYGIDVQVAADGSQLWLSRGTQLDLIFEPAGNGLVIVTLIEEWNIFGGTGRFEHAAAANGPIISVGVTEPFDLANPVGDFVFEKNGYIDLGRRNN